MFPGGPSTCLLFLFTACPSRVGRKSNLPLAGAPTLGVPVSVLRPSVFLAYRRAFVLPIAPVLLPLEAPQPSPVVSLSPSTGAMRPLQLCVRDV